MFIQAAISSFLFGTSDRKVVPSSGQRLDPEGPPLQGRSVAVVQPSHRMTTELTADDGKGLQKLPDVVLGIIAAAASDSVLEALPLLSVLTSGRSGNQARTSAWTQGLVVRVMFQNHPRLERESGREDLLRKLIVRPFDRLEDVLQTLEQRAQIKGHPPEEIRAWLSDDRTLGVLIANSPRLMNQLETEQQTKSLLVAYQGAGGRLMNIPPKGRNQAYWLLATSGPGSNADTLREVPDKYRTPELLRAAVAKHPKAYQYVRYLELEPAILHAAYAEPIRQSISKLTGSPSSRGSTR